MKTREIKFRAWNDEDKVMICAEHLAFEEYAPLVDQLNSCEHLMQFTGLFDKNGKEVYEGDVLCQDCNMVSDYLGYSSIEKLYLVVRWSEKRCGWSVYCPSALSKEDWGYVPGNAYSVGNVFENPSLINPSTLT